MLRSSRRKKGPGDDGGSLAVASGDWLTVREASEMTGVPTSTIRKWARHDNIPSFLEQTSDGSLRLVSITGIERWADELGRDIETAEPDPAEVDLREPEPGAAPDEPQAVPEAPEGSMIVPLDAWNRMLNQLGNLHEAGQQLADARERAAKAETEARFLKERLADLRDELESATRPTVDHDESGSPAPRQRSLVRKAYDGWRARRRSGR